MSAWIVYSKDGQTERCKLKKLEYSGSFMNERTVTATFEYHSEVAFEVFDYIVYRGEKFELEAIPSVKKISSVDYQYELRFVSLKYELERCEMRDIVPSDNGITYPTPLTFSFTGDVRYLTERIQANLDALYGQGVWSILVSDDVESEEKNITIAQQNCWNALSLVNTTYGLNFSIKGRVVTVGGNQSTVGHTFQYGKGNGLYEIERNSDTDTGIVTKLRAYGSTRNLDYSYPKKPEWTDSVLPVSFILSPLRLMLPSFKEDGKTDYILADEATISEYGIREASVIYDDIYPSITGATNSSGVPIDEIKSVEPIDDSASTFVVYLHDLEFDLESHLTTDNAQISMKSGAMQGYTFNISEIERISNNFYKITLGRITNDESDTGNYNIPNSSWHMEAGDKFVFLNILMPQKYIRDAEERLLKRAQEYLAEYGKTNFSYNVGLHDKFLKQHEDIYNELIEGAKLSVYDSELGISENVTIQSITITEYADDNILPQVKVALNNKPSASTLERIQGQIKELSETSAGQFSTQSELLKQYRRKLDKPFFDRLFAAVDFDGNEIPSTDMTTPIAYIKARFNFATLGGVTMYLDDKSLNLPSIYDGLPIDHDTIYWENGVLKAKGGGDTGGVDEDAVRTLIESYDYATKDFVRDYVLQNATGGEFELSKQMVIDALGFTPYSAENPNGYITAASIPSALKNPYALTFGSKTYDGSAAKSITASDLGAALSSDLAKYLPLSGGTVNGIIYLNNTSSQGSRISFKNNRTSESSWADNVINATDVNGNVIMRFGLYGTTDAFNYIFLGHNSYTGNNLRIYTDKVTFGGNTIWHAGNFNPADYLPLSGGQMTGSITMGTNKYLYGVQEGSGALIYFDGKRTVVGSAGASTTEGTHVRSKTGHLTVGTTASSGHTVWDSGNDGSGSGLDADLLDGLQPSELNVFSANCLASNKAYGTGTENHGKWQKIAKILISAQYQNGVFEAILCTRDSLTWNAYGTSFKVFLHVYQQDAMGKAPVVKLIWDNNNIYHNVAAIVNYNSSASEVVLYAKSDATYCNMYVKVLTGLNYRDISQTNYINIPSGDRVNPVSEVLAASAAKLSTARTIWGQSFDGSANIDGKFTIANNSTINSLDKDGTARSMMFLSSSNNLNIGYGTAGAGLNTYLYGNSVYLGYGTSRTVGLSVTAEGVGIGTGTTAPSAKLHVNGTANIDGTLTVGNTTSSELHFKRVNGTSVLGMHVSSSDNLHIGNGIAKLSKNTYIDGYNVYLRYSASPTVGMTLTYSGNVGVAITPEYRFHVEQKTDNTFASVYQTPKSKVYLAHSSGRGIYASVLSGVSTSYLLHLKYNQTTLGSGGSSALYVRTDGNIGAGTESPTAKLHVVGNILATGGVTMQSQRSLKNVVDERGLSITELSAIKPTRYTWKDKRDDRLHFGGIADDIEKVLPEVIYKTSDGTLTMDYGNAGFAIATSLIKPVVDHDTEIRMLKIRVKELEEELKRYSA